MTLGAGEGLIYYYFFFFLFELYALKFFAVLQYLKHFAFAAGQYCNNALLILELLLHFWTDLGWDEGVSKECDCHCHRNEMVG